MNHTFHKLLNPECFIEIEQNRRRVKFSENNTQSDTLQSVTIENLPENCFAFSFDQEVNYSFLNKNRKLKPKNYFLNTEYQKINSVSDGLIIHYKENEVEIMILEMKSIQAKYETQLVNTKLLIEYVLAMYQMFEKSITYKICLIGFSYKRPITLHKKGFGKKILKLSEENMQAYPEKYIKHVFHERQGYIEWQKVF